MNAVQPFTVANIRRYRATAPDGNQKQIAEVLGNHYISYQFNRVAGEKVWICTSLDCNFWSVTFADAIDHQAAMLAPLFAAAQAEAKAAEAQLDREAEALTKEGRALRRAFYGSGSADIEDNWADVARKARDLHTGAGK